jgi:5-methylthioadenosine/S-adenosylhomocysteine deaminase
MSLTVIRNAVIFTVDARDRVLTNGNLVIRDGLIEAIGQGEQMNLPCDARVIDCQGRMALLPGLVDTHSHSSLMRGVTENMQLMEWLPHYQLEHRAMNAEDAYHAARLCYLEALKNGTTCVMDMYRFMHRCADAAGELGIRVHLAPYAADVPGKDFFESPAANRHLIETHHMAHDGRVRVWMGLEHLFYCSPGAYAHARDCSRDYGIGIHTHACEQKEEEAAVFAHFGKRSIALLDERGILGENTLIAHCVWLDDEEIQRLAGSGTSVAHCPSSNAKLASGIARVPELQAAGVKVGLGTDGNVCNNSLDLFEEMKFASLLQKVHRLDAAALPAQVALRMATIDGARVLGMDREIGSIEVGKRADLLLLDLDQPNMQPVIWQGEDTNLLWNLVYSARGANVHTVMVDGRIILQAGRSTRVDEARLLGDAQAQALQLMERRKSFGHTLVEMV